MNRRLFSKTTDCLRALHQISIDNQFECYHCEELNYYPNKKNYSKMCAHCKTKSIITHNNMFHNLRFGLLKSFKIMDEVEKSDYTLSSIFIAEKYGVTQPTAWKFLKKLKENKDLVSQLLFKNIGRRRPIIGFNRIKAISKLLSLNEENR